MSVHVPVMLQEIMDFLNPQAGQIYIDATLGGGSYTKELAKAVGKRGQIIAIDWDEKALARFKKSLKASANLNIKPVLGNFADLKKIAKEEAIADQTCSGIVFDLGLSSDQLEDRSRGFSFKHDAPLNMAFSQDLERKSLEIINNYSLKDLVKIFKEYGEDPHAYRVSRAIVSFRRRERIARVKQLVEIIEQAIPVNMTKKRIHPATQYFQALRIATNDELNNLKQALSVSSNLLKKNGRIAVVSFHSGEDRLVKNFFRNQARACLCPANNLICSCSGPNLKILTKKPLSPTIEEIEENPRARSAKLRVAEKIN